MNINLTLDDLKILALPKYRFDERVKRLMNSGVSRQEATNIVSTVILKQEYPYERD